MLLLVLLAFVPNACAEDEEEAAVTMAFLSPVEMVGGIKEGTEEVPVVPLLLRLWIELLLLLLLVVCVESSEKLCDWF